MSHFCQFVGFPGYSFGIFLFFCTILYALFSAFAAAFVLALLEWLQPCSTFLTPKSQLHEQDELVWNDGVAPELAIDFDAPHYDRWTGLLMWLGGLGFFFAFYQFIALTDPKSRKPTVRAAAVASTQSFP